MPGAPQLVHGVHACEDTQAVRRCLVTPPEGAASRLWNAHSLHQAPVAELQQQLARAVRRLDLCVLDGAPCAPPVRGQLLPERFGHLLPRPGRSEIPAAS